MNTKNQHYVWRFYLKKWLHNEMIWCKRKGKTYPTSLSNVASETYYYKIELLNKGELEILRLLTKHPNRQQLDDLVDQYLTPFVAPSYANAYGKVPAEALKDDLINGHEKLLSRIEEQSKGALTALYNSQLDFFKVNDNRFRLLMYLSFSYTRTKRQRNNFLARRQTLVPEEFGEVDINKLWGPMSVYLSIHFAVGISGWDKPFNITLLINKSGVNFLTSDQPVVNLEAGPIHGETKDLELYHPLSPSMAMVLTKKSNADKIREIQDPKEVRLWNRRLLKDHLEQYYSLAERDLAV